VCAGDGQVLRALQSANLKLVNTTLEFTEVNDQAVRSEHTAAWHCENSFIVDRESFEH